jgi:hypothetical protein
MDSARSMACATAPTSADSLCFNKPQTSVLVKRPRAGLTFLVCVDEDLEYMGPDCELARVFAAADRQQGWRVVSAGAGVCPQAEDVVQQALAMLGAPSAAAVPAKPVTAPLTPWLLVGALNRGARLAATCLPPCVE